VIEDVDHLSSCPQFATHQRRLRNQLTATGMRNDETKGFTTEEKETHGQQAAARVHDKMENSDMHSVA